MKPSPLLLLLFAVGSSAQVTGASMTAASIGAPTVGGGGGGGGANVTAAIDCRSFGQTASDGGTLNIKYATPMMCWGTDSVVSGVAVNGSGWVPETWFSWDWDDNSLGTVARGGLTVDLGKSIGMVAAHAFKPTSYAETCNGGTNSSHTVTLTVYSIVGGLRESDSASLTVCVEDPATTWPNPVAYCNDADCSNDSFTNVVNPGTPSNGGNLTDLATILDKCDSNGATGRILVEGGVTFTTASKPTVGGQSCLVESYGTGNATLHFTATTTGHAIQVEDAAGCAGYRMNDLTFAGGGASTGLIGGADSGGSANRGCYVLIDSHTSTTPGEEFGYLSVVDPAGTGVQTEGYYFKFDYTNTPSNGIAQFYIAGDYTAFVGGEISGVNGNVNAEHNMRLPQWNYVVIDSTLLKDQQWDQPGPGATAKSLLTMRQDCGGTSSCPNHASASFYAITRSEFIIHPDGTDPIEQCTSGSGSEQTKCYDGDILENAFKSETTGVGADQYIHFQGGGSAGNEQKRIRLMQNAVDLSGLASTNSRFFTIGSADDVAVIGNVIVDTAAAGTARVMGSGSTQLDIVRDNGCFDAGNLCDMFPSFAEDTTCNPEVTSNPFSVSPGQYTAFDLTDVTIANGSAFDDACSTPTPYPSDVVAGACDSLYDVGPYCTP